MATTSAPTRADKWIVPAPPMKRYTVNLEPMPRGVAWLLVVLRVVALVLAIIIMLAVIVLGVRIEHALSSLGHQTTTTSTVGPPAGVGAPAPTSTVLPGCSQYASPEGVDCDPTR